VFDVGPRGLVLREHHPEMDVAALRRCTEADFELHADLKPFALPCHV